MQTLPHVPEILCNLIHYCSIQLWTCSMKYVLFAFMAVCIHGHKNSVCEINFEFRTTFDKNKYLLMLFRIFTWKRYRGRLINSGQVVQLVLI